MPVVKKLKMGLDLWIHVQETNCQVLTQEKLQ